MIENMFRAVALTAMLSVGMAAFAQDEPEVCEAEKKSEVIMHRVTYVANDGTDDRVDTMFQHGTNMCGYFFPNYRHTLGCHFVGWNTEPDGSGCWLGSIYDYSLYEENRRCRCELLSDMTLYAIWKYLPQPKAVDLGLPSGKLWADANFGASSPEDRGETSYWFWYDNSNYGYYDSERKVVIPSMKLKPWDDYATLQLGDNWRTPSCADFAELLEHCNWKWTTLNGVDGYRVSSKVNGNSIFLPVTVDNEYGKFGHYISADLSLGEFEGCLPYYLGFSRKRREISDEYNEVISLRPVCVGEVTGNLDYSRPKFDIMRYDAKQTGDFPGSISSRVAYLSAKANLDTLFYAPYDSRFIEEGDAEFCYAVDYDGLPFHLLDPDRYYISYYNHEDGVYKWSYFKSWNTMPDGTGTTLMPGDLVSLDGNMTIYSQWEDISDIPAVDLGLPSGNMWLSRNLGAKSPEEIGFYTKHGGIWPFTQNFFLRYPRDWSDERSFKDYIRDFRYDPDNIGELIYFDILAYPSKADYEELIKYCDWERVTRAGVRGYLVTSRVNSASIFLPETGCLDYSGEVKNPDCAYYWTSDVNKSDESESKVYHFLARRAKPRFGMTDYFRPMPVRMIKKKSEYKGAAYYVSFR